jgi:histidinol phosphatase-like enzyme
MSAFYAQAVPLRGRGSFVGPTFRSDASGGVTALRGLRACYRDRMGDPHPRQHTAFLFYAKPDPDLCIAAAEKLGVNVETASVVGDSVWDMLAARRARSLGIGLLSGGYGMEELERGRAYRVFADPEDLLQHLDEVGGRR